MCISCFDFIVYIQSDSMLHWSSAKVVFLLMYSMFRYGTFLYVVMYQLWTRGYIDGFKGMHTPIKMFLSNEAYYASHYTINII